jgi:hypothetical protein
MSELVERLMKEATFWDGSRTHSGERVTDLLREAATALAARLPDREGRWCPDGTVLIPQSLDEAKMMNLISERYILDHDRPPAKAPTAPYEGGDASGWTGSDAHNPYKRS